MKLTRLLLVITAFTPAFARAGTEVRFTNPELNAGFVLVRPELNSIELNGRTGVFTPAPALRFFGLDELRFQINFNSLIDLVDLEFNHLKAKVPEIRFQSGALELTIPLYDQEKVLRSRLGSISITGVSLVAVLSFVTRPNGAQEIVLKRAQFNGDLKGSGILKSAYILMKTKTFLLKILTEQVNQVISQPAIQTNLDEGLKTWARFQLGYPVHSVVPGSIDFYEQGLKYQVE